MKISGIVCEYNPFHNGHMYHIGETRRNGATHIVCAMSGNFVQRGDTAVLDKFTRAALAVRCGADLVLEIPVAYCLSSAENYARGAVGVLDSLGVVDELSFGSECGDTSLLMSAAELSDRFAHSEDVRRLMERGYTYPKALCEVVGRADSRAAEVIASPNNLLAVEYIKALGHIGSQAVPFTVRRTGAAHDSTGASGNTASASYIREHLDSAADFVPGIWAAALGGETAELKNLGRVLLYRVRTAKFDEITRIGDSNGIAERIYRNNAASLDELFASVKSKAVTMARVRRVLLSLLIGVGKEDTAQSPPYARVLALNERGREVLALSRKKQKIPVGTSLAKLCRTGGTAERFAELESTATDIYSLAAGKIRPAGVDYTVKTELIRE